MIFARSQLLVVDMSRTQQWRQQYDRKYITAPERYCVVRFIAEIEYDLASTDKIANLLAFYSSMSPLYIATFPLPVDFWQLSPAPEPFFEYRIPFLASVSPQLYNLGRPLASEFLFRPHDALKRFLAMTALLHARHPPSKPPPPTPVSRIELLVVPVDTPAKPT